MPRANAILPVFLLATLAVVGGWHLCWFLTDDAHIQFRYVSNSILGHGYVWNPPPFLPVEGYTSFLWVLLLDGVWRITGIQPPQAACSLSLVFSLLTLWLTGRMVLGMRLRSELEPYRAAWLAVVLAGVATNRTFLTWTSSGLETALFNFSVLLWSYAMVRLAAVDAPRHAAGLAAAGALVYLARPEGLLYGASTLLLCGAWCWRRRHAGAPTEHAAALGPLLVIPAHMVWRRCSYGEWLPNTYYAKVVGAWPQAGWRYALSFALEYGLWFWAACLIVLAPRLLRSRTRRGEWSVHLVVLTLLAHAAYYTLIVGGDHFEYRAFSYLVPFVPLSLLWLLNRSSLRPVLGLGAGAALVLVAAPIPWLHWSLTQGPTTPGGPVPIAQHLPRPLRWYGELFDETQAWLIERSVGNRRHEHVVTYRHLKNTYPERLTGGAEASGEPLILCANAVGVPAWNLPHVAILDTKGLNDFVVARTPLPAGHERRMAHDRIPPAGYLSDYRPNVRILGDPPVIEVRPRNAPLGDAEVAELERKWHRRAREWVEGRHRRWPAAPGNVLVVDIGAVCSERVDASSAPRLAAFAGECFVFEHAISSSPATVPAAVSLLTSLRPEVHGVTGAAGGLPLPERATTLAEVLRGAGYATAAFVERGLGLQRGFELYAETDGTATRDPRPVLDWLGGAHPAPFFAYVRLDTPAAREDPTRTASELHDARLRAVDHQVGALLDALVDLELESRTLVAIVSAHGVELGGAGRLAPELILFEQVLPMLLMLRVPGYYFEPGTFAGPAHTIDLMPTLLDLLGLEGAAITEGQSLVPAMRYESTGTEEALDFDSASGLAALRLGRWRLFAETPTGRSLLYLDDRKRGPLQDLRGENPDVTADLEAALERGLERRLADDRAARARLGL